MPSGATPAFPPFGSPAPGFKDGIFVCAGPAKPHDDGAEGENLRRLNAVARLQGWREGVAAAYGAEMLDYVDNPQRLVFLPLLPLQAGDAILEIGPGLGQISIPVARRVATVDALEVTRGQAEFCAERCRQENVENVRISAGGEDCQLPYADGVFNGVILNLVLEWCGCRADRPHAEMHRKLLAEVARVLKPGGFFYVATKNRFSLRLLTGGQDEHMLDLRVGSALPRWLGRLLLRGRRPLGHLHSYRELRSLLAKSGLDPIQSYWATPEMRWPTHLIPIESRDFARARRQAPQGESRRTAAIGSLLPSFMVKHVAPGLNFLARKTTARTVD